MPTSADILIEYKKCLAEIARLEEALEAAKVRKSDACGALAKQHGKGPWDLGDGEPMIITISKIGTFFFTPKDKWKKKADARVQERQERAVILQAKDQAKGVAPKEVAPKASVKPVPITATLTGGGVLSTGVTAPGEALDATSKTDVPRTPTAFVVGEEFDPLAAALAEAMGSS